jgi:hypothetical protein
LRFVPLVPDICIDKCHTEYGIIKMPQQSGITHVAI